MGSPGSTKRPHAEDESPPMVLLATCRRFPEGEPGAVALDAALEARGITSRWVCWDDPTVDWDAAGLVAVRSTWDYSERIDEFLSWCEAVGSRLLHGHAVFSWNTHKGYLAELGAAGVPIVPTEVAQAPHQVSALVRRDGAWVVKPAVGAGGVGVELVDGGGWRRNGEGPWVVQPYADSITGEGELSVFVFDGEPAAQVEKRPRAGEIRVHGRYGGTSVPVSLTEEATAPSLAACAAAERILAVDLAYARVDLLRLDGRLVVSEVELTEPGLYLDVMPANSVPFADAVARRVTSRGRCPLP